MHAGMLSTAESLTSTRRVELPPSLAKMSTLDHLESNIFWAREPTP